MLRVTPCSPRGEIRSPADRPTRGERGVNAAGAFGPCRDYLRPSYRAVMSYFLDQRAVRHTALFYGMSPNLQLKGL